MRSSKSPIHWSKGESQLMPCNSTCLKIVARGELRAARVARFCERVCREERQCNKYVTKTNILTIFHTLTSILIDGCMNLQNTLWNLVIWMQQLLILKDCTIMRLSDCITKYTLQRQNLQSSLCYSKLPMDQRPSSYSIHC
jgi:hypothetical protein